MVKGPAQLFQSSSPSRAAPGDGEPSAGGDAATEEAVASTAVSSLFGAGRAERGLGGFVQSLISDALTAATAAAATPPPSEPSMAEPGLAMATLSVTPDAARPRPLDEAPANVISGDAPPAISATESPLPSAPALDTAVDDAALDQLCIALVELGRAGVPDTDPRAVHGRDLLLAHLVAASPALRDHALEVLAPRTPVRGTPAVTSAVGLSHAADIDAIVEVLNESSITVNTPLAADDINV